MKRRNLIKNDTSHDEGKDNPYCEVEDAITESNQPVGVIMEVSDENSQPRNRISEHEVIEMTNQPKKIQ